MEALAGVFDDLMALVAVVEAGGFSAASRRFDIPVSRLSRRVAALEQQLGVSLLTRNARRFQVTDVGARLYQHGLSMRAQAQNALSIARESLGEPAGHLRVACPMALGASVVGPLVLAFLRKYPRMAVTLASTDGQPSAFSDPIDLLIQPSSKALRDSSLVARKLVDAHHLLVAAPALQKTLARPATPPDLAGCPTIGWTFHPHPARWTLVHAEHGATEVGVEPRFFSDNLVLIRDAALAGIGVAQLPLAMCGADLQAGRLQVVAPGWAPPPIAFHALYPSRRTLTPGGRCFLDLLAEAFVGLGRPPG